MFKLNMNCCHMVKLNINCCHMVKININCCQMAKILQNHIFWHITSTGTYIKLGIEMPKNTE